MGKGIKAEQESNPPIKKENTLLEQTSFPGAERVCVGAPLIDNNLFFEFGKDFPEEAFTTPEWKALYKLERHLHNKGYQVDKNTIINCADKFPEVAEMLEKAGGSDLLDRAMAIQDTKNFDKYLTKIRGAHEKRMTIHTKEQELAELKKIAIDEEVEAKDLIKIIDNSNAELSAKIYRVDNYHTLSFDPEAELAKSIKANEEGRNFNGIKTNMRPWDDWLGGLANGRLYVMGAGTGYGKSLFNISMLVSSAYGVLPGDPGSRHLVIDTGELVWEDDFKPRMLANMSGVHEHKISGKTWHINEMDRRRVMAAMNRYNADKRIFWYQMPDFDGPAVRNLIRRMVHKEGIQCVWFDNIKINPNWKASEQYAKIGDLAQYLKDAAVSLGIPVFALIQLTNDGTTVGQKKLAMEINVDMFAGGRRVLQNADMGLTMDYLDKENDQDDSRKVKVGKSRFTPWHRKEEHFVLEGDLRQCSLMIVDNILKNPERIRKNGLVEVIQDQGNIDTTAAALNGRRVTVVSPKIIVPEVDLSNFDDDFFKEP